MQLTRFTDLGLRVLMYLGCERPNQPVTIPEIAERFAISRNHLVKVVHYLAQNGWIATTRGKGGGLRLSRPTREYRLGEVIRSLEGDGPLIDCATPPCVLRPGCLLKESLHDAHNAFYADLDRRTLADLLLAPTGSVLIQLHREAAEALVKPGESPCS